MRKSSDGEGGLSDEDVAVNADGRSYKAPAGSYITLNPGESVTLWPHQYHEFHAVPGTGSVLIGEVSQCNDELLAIYGKNVVLGASVLILGTGHIGIHLMHRREIIITSPST